MVNARAVLLDIDGVLAISWRPLDGAIDALRAIRKARLPYALLTNTTSRSRASIAKTLAGAGFPVKADHILTAPAVAAAYLREHRPGARVFLLNSGDVAEDLKGIRLVDEHERPDVVLTGGAGPEFGYAALNHAFRHLQRGAELMAMHANLFWRTSDGMQLDAGAFLLGLERAADTDVEVLGKPARSFFATALDQLRSSAEDAVMVGDDVESDVLGAQAHGITGVLVRTGKYRLGAEHGVDGRYPDHVIDSVADLPVLLGLG
jgi:HAD superfamily hydrolase (TIGR01458 family)